MKDKGRFLLPFAPALLAAALGGCSMMAPAEPAETRAEAKGLVSIMSLGSHDGELCRRDRAILMEDPNGLRLLYDPGRTVMGPDDPRLGRIDVVLLSSVHSDHLGDRRGDDLNRGTCAKPRLRVDASKYSNTVEVAVAKQAKLIAGGEMRTYLGDRMKKAGGNPRNMLVLRHGGKRVIKGVRIAVVATVHSNGLGAGFLEGELEKEMAENGLTAYAGPDSGFVVRFTNGLSVYLTGDTGHTSDMETIVGRYYKPQVAIVHMGDVFTMGPEEAAFAVNELIKPRAAIPVHANEASTEGGKVRPKSRVAEFKRLAEMPVHVPLSGLAMRFDGAGRCWSGC